MASTAPPLIVDEYHQLLCLLNEVTTQPTTNLVGMPLCLTSSIHLPSTWIIDTGATDHITTIPHLLQNTHPPSIFSSSIFIPNGSSVPITSFGQTKLTPNITLLNVLCAPTFKHNLISIHKMTTHLNYSVTFFPSQCIFQDLSMRKEIGRGHERGGLYYLQLDPSHVSLASTSLSSELWHQRLGHPSRDRLNKLQTTLSFSSNNAPFACDVCPLAKQHYLPFPSSSICTIAPFELIHCDIWGCYSIPSSGARYFLTIVDDFTCCTWNFLMKFKFDTYGLICNFFAHVRTQHNCSIKQIQIDNGSEFFSKRMQSFLNTHGVLHQHSCIATPQQNGVVERKHHHLLNEARALRFQAHLPSSFWSDCLLTATYLINRIPTPILNGLTPYEVLFQKPPSYDHLRVFGYLCYASFVHLQHDKFGPRARRCIFVGYPPSQRGYRLFDLGTHQHFSSRDVIFHKTIFPYKDHFT